MKPELIFLSVFLALVALLVVFFSLRGRWPNPNKKAGKEPCQAVQEAANSPTNPSLDCSPDFTPVILSTPAHKLTRADALKAANRNRQAEGRLRAQKAKDALANNEDPAKVAAECGYKTIKYMKEKVRELERGGLPA